MGRNPAERRREIERSLLERTEGARKRLSSSGGLPPARTDSKSQELGAPGSWGSNAGRRGSGATSDIASRSRSPDRTTSLVSTSMLTPTVRVPRVVL